MKAFRLLLVGLFIPATCLVTWADSTTTNQITKLKDVKHAAWQQGTNTILRTTKKSSVKVDAKKTKYQLTLSESDGFLSVTAFVSPHLKKPWVGPESDFYVELSSGVIGGRLESGQILWCENLVPKSNTSTTNLIDAINRFEAVLDIDALMSARGGGLDDDLVAWHARLTELRFIYKSYAFEDGQGSSTTSSYSKIVAAEMEGNDLKVTIENLSSQFVGVAWINPKTRKVTKATEGGKPIVLRDEMGTPFRAAETGK